MIKHMLIAALTANCNVPCPAVQNAIDVLAKEFGANRSHMLARLPLLDRASFHDLLMVAWAKAPMKFATGRTRDEWIDANDTESRRAVARPAS